jgi:hypothetical protein
MNIPLKIHVILPALSHRGAAVLEAAEAARNQLKARLAAGVLAGARRHADQLGEAISAQHAAKARAGKLTQTRNQWLAALVEILGSARATARLALKNQPSILRNQFLIGMRKPTGMAETIERARLVAIACREHLEALKDQGWTEADTARLEAAIEAVAQTDREQEVARISAVARTDARNALANAFHADLKRIQNAANLQWPASHPAHAEQRALFRLRASPRAKSARTAAAPVVVPLAAPVAAPAEDPAKALVEWPDGAATIAEGSPPSPWPSPPGEGTAFDEPRRAPARI